MQQQELIAFLTVVECRSISKAAAQLFITQPTLSHQINELEKELGVSLLIRSRGVKEVKPTAEGRTLISYANRWISLWDEMKTALADETQGQISMCAVHSIGYYIFPDFYRQFLARYPSCFISLAVLPSKETYQRINAKEIDIALLCFPKSYPGIKNTPIAAEEIVMVCTEGSDYDEVVDTDSLSVENEVHLNWCVEYANWYNEHFSNRGTPYFATESMQQGAMLFTGPNIWATVPISAAEIFVKEKNMRICKLTDTPPRRTIYMVSQTASSQKVCKMVEESLRESLSKKKGFTLL